MAIPPIPEKFKYATLNTIDKRNTEELFAFLVRRLYATARQNEFLNHIQMSNLIFKESDSILLKKVTNDFDIYFERFGQKKTIKPHENLSSISKQ